jgi:hypothetical protein
MFAAQDHAYQWSGTSASRFRAEKIQVRAGASTTYNYVLKTGTLITGTIQQRDGTAVDSGWLSTFNPETGDFAGEAYVWEDKPFELRLLSPSLVKLTYEYKYWYDGTSYESSGVLPTQRPHSWLGLCVANDTTMHYCPQH